MESRCRHLAPTFAVLLSAFAVVQAPALAQEPGARRPNILMIVADDLGFNDLGAQGNEIVQTPNIDRLAESSIRFTRFYTAGDICAPTRASLLTGLYPQRLGFRGGESEIPPEVTTLPESLRDAGYETYHVGKWHLGRARPESLPLAQGYDGFFGFHHARELGPRVQIYQDPLLITNDQPPRVHRGHLTGVLSRRAASWIRTRSSDRPWFLSLWYYAPHVPIQAPARWVGSYRGQPRGKYYGLVSALDEGVGQVLEALAASGQARDTVVVFLSDNGSPYSESNRPFFGRKTQAYEGGLRVPLIIGMPRTRGARVVDEIVSSLDVAPTLSAIAGASLGTGKRDGRSLVPLLTGGDRIEGRPLFWEARAASQARKIRPEAFSPVPAELGSNLDFSVLSADGRWRLTKERMDLSLFDLVSDPRGARSVARQHPDVVDELARLYREWTVTVRTLPVHAEASGGAGFRSGVAELGGRGRVDLAGHDLMRTPARHAWSFGVGVEPARIEGKVGIVSQSEVWSMTLDETGRVRVDLGGARLSAGGAPAGACTPVVLDTRLGPRHEAGLARLYVGGQLADSGAWQSTSLRGLENPTSLGVASGTQPFVGRLRNPVFANRALQAAEVEELSRSLCPPSGGAGD